MKDSLALYGSVVFKHLTNYGKVGENIYVCVWIIYLYTHVYKNMYVLTICAAIPEYHREVAYKEQKLFLTFLETRKIKV